MAEYICKLSEDQFILLKKRNKEERAKIALQHTLEMSTKYADKIKQEFDLVKELENSNYPCLDEIRKGKIKALPIENFSMVRETRIVYNKDFSHKEVLDDILRIYGKTASI